MKFIWSKTHSRHNQTTKKFSCSCYSIIQICQYSFNIILMKRCFFDHGKLKRCYETNEMVVHDKYGKCPNYSINSWLRECFYNLRPFVPKSSALNTTKVSKTIYILGNYSWIIIFAVPAGIFFFSITENDNFYSIKSDIISI